MELTRNQYIFFIEGKKAHLRRGNQVDTLDAFVFVLNENGIKKITTSKGDVSATSENPFLFIAGTKKRVEFVTVEKVAQGASAPKMKGEITLIYTLKHHYGLYLLQARYDEEKECYETIRTFIDLLQTEKMFDLALQLMQTCAVTEKTNQLEDKEIWNVF